MPLSWIMHNGKKILYNDFSKEPDETARIRQLEEELKLLANQSTKVLMLVDITNAVLGRDFMARAKQLAPQFEAHLERQAIIGVDGLKSILLSGFNAFSRGIPLKPFSSAQAAKDYLTA